MCAASNICIFGGTFDPPHEGHVTALRELLEKFSTVVIAVTAKNPWKAEQPNSLDLRREMLRLVALYEKLPLVAEFVSPGIFISDFAYTYAEEFVNHVRASYTAKLSWAVGEDIKDDVKKWRNWDKLNIGTVVVPIVIPIHATMVRGGTIPIHPALVDFARKNGLYSLV